MLQRIKAVKALHGEASEVYAEKKAKGVPHSPDEEMKKLKLLHIPLPHCEARAATLRNQLWWVSAPLPRLVSSRARIWPH